MKFFTSRFKAAVARGIANLIMYTQQRGFKSDEWIRAIPLYHFLMECVQPFDPPEMNPLKIIWSDMGKELSLNEVRKKAEPGLVPLLVFLAKMPRVYIRGLLD